MLWLLLTQLASDTFKRNVLIAIIYHCSNFQLSMAQADNRFADRNKCIIYHYEFSLLLYIVTLERLMKSTSQIEDAQIALKSSLYTLV